MSDKKRDNPKSFDKLNQQLMDMDRLVTKVGWFESAVYPSDDGGRPVAMVAAGNELGIASRNIPARPFFRPTVSEKQTKWQQDAATLSARVVEGKMSAFDAMDTLGGIVEGDVANTIASITSPPLSPITLGARKYRQMGKKVTGRTIGEIARLLKEGKLDVSGVTDKPLVDSQHMINTLTHVTEKE